MIKYYLLLFISIWHINIYANNHYASDPVHNTIAALAPPANDLCANATLLTPGTSCTYTAGTFSGALNDGGTSCVATASQDVWYKFTATDPTMKVTVPAIYDLNHAIQIFQGGCNGSLFACANTSGQNGAETVFRNDFIPGQEYYVRVINVFTLPSTFNFNICVTNYPTPANDLCANATQLTPGTACTYTAGTFSGALNDGGTSCVATASQDVWYKFTATDPTMKVTVDAIYDLNHAIQIFQGGCNGSLFACGNTSGQNGAETVFRNDFIPGQEYYVRVINVFTQVSTFNFNICVTKYPLPVNDLCANAIQLTPGTACNYTAGTFSGALNDGGTSCVATASQDVWYKFTATDPTMKVTVDAIYDLNHAIQIFQGGCNGSLFACANTSGQNGTETVFRNDFIPGQEYYVRVINVFTQVSTFNFNICVNKYPLPVNDLCANAIQLTPGTTCNYTAGTFSGALNDGGTSCVATASQDVWYKFTATDPTMRITVDAIYDLNHAIQIFQGGCNGSLFACANTSGQNGTETVFRNDFIPGQEYYVRVINVFTQVSTFNFNICVTKYPLPVNDLCANAIQLTPGTACNYTAGTFSGALNDGGTSCVATASQDVWYKFTATDPTMRITVDGIYDLNHAIQVFQGGCNGSLFACANTSGQNGTETVFRSDFIPGQEYYVRVINVFTQVSAFNFNICVTKYLTPANDLCANAIELIPTLECSYIAGTINGALKDGDTATCAPNALQDVWYKFTATDATMSISMPYSPGINQAFQILQGGCNGTVIACVNNFGMEQAERYMANNFIIGQQYYIRVLNDGGFTSTSNFYICVAKYPAPANDLCANAVELTPNLECSYTNGTISGALRDGTATTNCTNNAQQDVWYKFTATDVTMGINMSYSDGIDQAFQIIQGGCNGTVVACVNNQGMNQAESYINNNFIIGQEYYIRVLHNGGSLSNTGFLICINKYPPPANDLCANATEVFPDTTCNYIGGTFSASHNDGTTPVCPTGTASQDIWYKFVATEQTYSIYMNPVSGFNPGFQIFEGSCNGTMIACVNNGGNNVSEYYRDNIFVIGQTYYIRFFHLMGGYVSQNITFCITKYPKPAYDTCENATLLYQNTSCTPIAATFSGAMFDGPSISCAPVAGQDLWFKFIAEGTSANIYIGPMLGTDLGYQVFQGGCNGTSIACINGYGANVSETANISNLTLGEEYYIRVFNAFHGPAIDAFTICVYGSIQPCTASVSVAASSTQICTGSPVTFTATPVNGGASPQYQWKLNGNNVGTNSPVFTPSNLMNGDTVSVVMTSSATCASVATVTSNVVTMNVTNPQTPAFAQIAAICPGGSFTLPATSTNGITGTWSPAVNNTVTTTYTFTPNAGQCATTTTMTVTVGNNIVPTFTQIAPICNGTSITLPTTSANGITGTWSPAVNNTATTTYTFTPNAGQCATTTTMTVTVGNNIVPTFTQIAAICSGTSITLPATSTNGITGTWSPAVNNTATTTYTFTPNAGQCATTTTMTVTVGNNIVPTFTQIAPICSGTSYTLPATSTNGITGTWSPAVNSTATTTYTFTPNAGQCATTTTMTVTVGNNIVPTFTQIAPICSGTSYTLPATSTNGITGTWSPAINSTFTTTYTFTPNAGQCATTANMTVEVTSIDTAVTVFSNTITATTSSLGATYQWIDCANNQPISGETDFFYVATENGSYAVIITENGCSATSECTVISGLGIKPVEKSSWKLYPNPTSDVLFIDTNETLDIVITDMTGKTIIHQRLKSGENSIKVSNLSSGVYMVNSESGMHAKFIKK